MAETGPTATGIRRDDAGGGNSYRRRGSDSHPDARRCRFGGKGSVAAGVGRPVSGVDHAGQASGYHRSQAQISAQGGDLVTELTQQRATKDKTKNFVLFDHGVQHFYEAQSGLTGEGQTNHKSLYQLPASEYRLKEGQDTLEVRLEAPASASGLRVVKTYTFQRGSYEIGVAHEVLNQGGLPVSPHAYFQIARDGKAPEGDSDMMPTFTGPAVYTELEKFQKINFEDIAKGKAKHATKADNGWIAMVQHYFVAALLPPVKAEREFFTRKIGDDL